MILGGGEGICLKRPYKTAVKRKLQGKQNMIKKQTVYIPSRSSLMHSLKNMVSHTPVDSRTRSRISCSVTPILPLYCVANG